MNMLDTIFRIPRFCLGMELSDFYEKGLAASYDQHMLRSECICATSKAQYNIEMKKIEGKVLFV